MTKQNEDVAEKLAEYLHEQLTKKQAIIDSKPEQKFGPQRINIAKCIMTCLEGSDYALSSFKKDKPLIDNIIQHISSDFNRWDAGSKLRFNDIFKASDTTKEEFNLFIRETVNEGIVDFALQKRFPSSPHIIQSIKHECNMGENFYVRHELTFLLAEHIESLQLEKSYQQKEKKQVERILYGILYPDTNELDNITDEKLRGVTIKAQELIQSALTVKQALNISQEISRQNNIRSELQGHFDKKTAENLHHHMREKDKKSHIHEERSEHFEQATELSEQSSEMIKLVGEFAEKSHHLHTMSHAAEATSKTLTKIGGIGTLISGILGAFSIPVLCALQKRKPTLPEVGLIALSLTTIVLGALAIAAVGGPVGVGAFLLSATVIGFGKTLITYYKDFRERRHLKKEEKNLRKEQDDLSQKLEEKQNTIDKLQKQLEAELNHLPSNIDHDKITLLHKELNRLVVEADQLKKELSQVNKDYAKTSVKLLELNKLHASVWHHAKTGIYATSGILAITGAALMLTPATAPVGIALMLTASAMSITTILSSVIVNRVKKHQAKKLEQHQAHQQDLISVQSINPQSHHEHELSNSTSMTAELGSKVSTAPEDKHMHKPAQQDSHSSSKSITEEANPNNNELQESDSEESSSGDGRGIKINL